MKINDMFSHVCSSMTDSLTFVPLRFVRRTSVSQALQWAQIGLTKSSSFFGPVPVDYSKVSSQSLYTTDNGWMGHWSVLPQLMGHNKISTITERSRTFSAIFLFHSALLSPRKRHSKRQWNHLRVLVSFHFVDEHHLRFCQKQWQFLSGLKFRLLFPLSKGAFIPPRCISCFHLVCVKCCSWPLLHLECSSLHV